VGTTSNLSFVVPRLYHHCLHSLTYIVHLQCNRLNTRFQWNDNPPVGADQDAQGRVGRFVASLPLCSTALILIGTTIWIYLHILDGYSTYDRDIVFLTCGAEEQQQSRRNGCIIVTAAFCTKTYSLGRSTLAGSWKSSV
jgi:hypothetical protein